MQAQRDISREDRIKGIFAIWPSRREMAQEVGAKEETVRGWERQQRIPEDWWPGVTSAAAKRDRIVTTDDLLAANRLPKQRGRPAHKVRKIKSFRRRRIEARA